MTSEDDTMRSSPIRKRHVRKDKESDTPASAPNRIRQGIHQQQRHEAAQHRRIARIQQQSHNSLQKFFLVIVMNAILLLMGGILYLRPDFFFSQYRRPPKREWPPHHVALLYPPNVSPHRDLPRFFESYAIATPENADARTAVRHLLKMRQKLKPFSILVTGWERNQIMRSNNNNSNVHLDDHCGTGFQQAYESAVQRGAIRHSEDLILWCLVNTYQNDGFLQWNATIERAPTSSIISSANTNDNTNNSVKGLAAKYVGHGRIHPFLLWVPKRKEIHHVNTTDIDSPPRQKALFDMDTDIPLRMLSWLIRAAPQITDNAPGEYHQVVEEYLYQLMQAESEKWVFLDVVCEEDTEHMEPSTLQQVSTQTVVARECQSRHSCCTIYMPHALEDTRMRQLRNRQDDEEEK